MPVAVRSETELGVERKRVSGPVVAGVSFLALVLLIGAYVGWANYLPPLRVPAPAMPRPNGFDSMIAAALKLPVAAPASPLDAPVVYHSADICAALPPSLPALQEARASLRYEFGIPGMLTGRTEDARTKAVRQLLFRLSILPHALLREGRNGDALDCSLDLLDLCVRLGNGEDFTDSANLSPRFDEGLAMAERCLSSVPAAEARAAGVRLVAIRRCGPSFSAAARTARDPAMLNWQLSLTTPSSGDASLDGLTWSAPAASGEQLRKWLIWRLYPKPLWMSRVSSYYAGLIAAGEQPYARRVLPDPPGGPPLDRAIAQQSFSVENGTLARECSMRIAGDDARLRLLHIELAIRAFRLEAGRCPEQLSELTPAYLAALPGDPFTERPMVYRRQGSGYVLYSLGPDRRDDGGKSLQAPDEVGTDSTVPNGDLVAGKLSARDGNPDLDE